MVYDNACNLKEFILNKKNRVYKDCESVSHTEILDHIHCVVDRLHIQGHKDPICLANCHPDNFPELKGKNTMVCEQTNSWACKYKFACAKMNWLRLNFFFTIVFDLFNESKINQPKIFSEYFKTRKPRSQKYGD